MRKMITARISKQELDDSNYFNDKWYDLNLLEEAFKDVKALPAGSEFVNEKSPVMKDFNKALKIYDKLFEKKVAEQKKMIKEHSDLLKETIGLWREVDVAERKQERMLKTIEPEIARLESELDPNYTEREPFGKCYQMIVEAGVKLTRRECIAQALAASTQPEVRLILRKVLGETCSKSQPKPTKYEGF